MNKREIEQRLSELDAERSRLEDELKELDKKPTPDERLLSILTGCTIERDEKKFPGRIFLMKGGKYFFEIEKPYLWCSYANVWSVFENEYGMGCDEIQVLINKEVEEHFGMKGITPHNPNFIARIEVEEHFGMTGITPDAVHPKQAGRWKNISE